MPENHLFDSLSAYAGRNPEKPFALRVGHEPRSFGQLFHNAQRFAAAITSAGFKPGDRLAAQVDKSLEAIELYLGVVAAGGVFLPLNPAYTASELAYFLSDASPSIVVCDPARENEIAPLCNKARLFTLGSDGSGTLTDALTDALLEPIARTADDLAAILYTSGTTGRSKGAMLSHDNLFSNSQTLTEYWHFSDSDVLIHALPIFHTHGLFVATNVALLSGATVHFQSGFSPDQIIEALPTSTSLMGVPTFYTRLLADPRLTPELTANMRLFISGSAPLLTDTHEQWQTRTGHRILERYGMTETNMNTSNPYNGARRAGTVGLPLPGVELRVVGAEGPLPQGEIGTLEVRGANVFKGYWQMPEKTAEELRPDGWFITGDLGIVDKQGYVSIVGRGKDLIITGGFNVYPKEIEALIDDIEGVKESAVIGVPHADFGEGIVAVIVPENERLTENNVNAVLATKLAKFKQPKKLLLLPELPRNTMGKVQKKALRETYANLFT
ncbi:malonyl-CoA synthase [Lentibacter algarum]|uniref:malonate--CoA ligase n=1 Tax=Lentibacter algarum TaxID=576131 RepID=UPI001C07E78B|nr:malonyl-CoA synthase [Lentibacter algarum]MBU2980503.1 malonyl-CoA synthase [Lentibacter algarum]